MTARDDQQLVTPEFDRLMTAWLEAEARVHEPPELIERTIAQRSRTRPRPGWLLPERWLPMELTMRRVRFPRVAPYLVLLALVILAAGALVIVGARRAVPPPFGLAANGRVAIATPNGDIATVDPFTGEVSVVVAGPESDRFPAFSLDGRRIAFVRSVTDGEAIVAVDAEGGTPTLLTPVPMAASGRITGLAWSPDSRQLALLAGDKLWIVAADGSDAHPVALGFAPDAEVEWRPPDGKELLVRGVRDGLAGLFLIPMIGGDARAITPTDGGVYDYLWPTWSPDGNRLAYSSDSARSVHLLTVDGSDIQIVPDGGQDVGFPRFSPDATRLAMMAWLPDGKSRIAVASAADPTPTLTLTGPTFTTGMQFDWSPDGTSILVAEWDSDQPWILDPSGGPGTPATFHGSFPDWVDWQRRAR